MSADLYPRPSRERIAERIAGQAGAPQPPRPPQGEAALARFARALQGRMRALGLDQAALQARAGVSAHVAGRAVNGTAVDLGTADKIAAAVGADLAAMVGPYSCSTCDGAPPRGFRCLECGAEAAAS